MQDTVADKDNDNDKFINPLCKDEMKERIKDAIRKQGYHGLRHFTMHYQEDCKHRAEVFLDDVLGYHNHYEINEKLDQMFDTSVKHKYKDAKCAFDGHPDPKAIGKIASDQASDNLENCEKMHKMVRGEVKKKKEGH